jgi:hypothetical protein
MKRSLAAIVMIIALAGAMSGCEWNENYKNWQNECYKVNGKVLDAGESTYCLDQQNKELIPHWEW